MEPFENAGAQLLAEIDIGGWEAASPINMSLPMIVDLVAGYVSIRAALECDHCIRELGFTEVNSEPKDAIDEALMGHAWLVNMLLLRLGTMEPDGERVPWLPDWAEDGYVEFLENFDLESFHEIAASKNQNTFVSPIYVAYLTEEWMHELINNFMTVLVIEFGFRMEPRLSSSPAIRELAERWDNQLIEDVFTDGLLDAGIEDELCKAALEDSMELIQEYLGNIDDPVSPPPGIEMH